MSVISAPPKGLGEVVGPQNDVARTAHRAEEAGQDAVKQGKVAQHTDRRRVYGIEATIQCGRRIRHSRFIASGFQWSTSGLEERFER